MAILAVHDVKVDHEAVAKRLGDPCTARAVQERLKKLRKMAREDGFASVLDEPSTPKKRAPSTPRKMTQSTPKKRTTPRTPTKKRKLNDGTFDDETPEPDMPSLPSDSDVEDDAVSEEAATDKENDYYDAGVAIDGESGSS